MRTIKISDSAYALLEELALSENKMPAKLVEELATEREKKNHIVELL